MPDSRPPRVGDLAPDFLLLDPAGRTLADLRGRADVVVFFYPKDQTPGCTAQACSYRDDHAEFRRRGVEVVGVSGDSAESHRGFADRHRLPYHLVPDGDGSIRRRFGVRPTWGFIPGRVSYLIDRAGIIRAIHESQFRPASHVPAMLAALDRVQAEAGGSTPSRPDATGGVGAEA